MKISKICVILFIVSCLMLTAGSLNAVTLDTSKNEDIVDISSFAMNSKQEMFLLSFKLRKVFKFNADGTYVKSFCRHGEGPGEINRVLSISINPHNDDLYLPEYYSGTGKITIYDSDGNYKDLMKFGKQKVNLDRVKKLTFNKSGSFYITTNQRVDWKPAGKFFITQDEIAVKSYDKNRKFIAPIYTTKLPGELAHAVRYGGPSILFKPDVIVRQYLEDGVAIGHTDENTIHFYNNKGKKTNSVKLNLQREKLSDDEFKARKKMSLEYFQPGSRMQYLAKNMIKLEFKPSYGTFYFTEKYIVVVKDKERNASEEVAGSILLFFDFKGKKIGEQELKGFVAGIFGNAILTVTSAPDGNNIYKAESVNMKLLK